MQNRESGLDLLRCLALLFVVIFHAFLYSGYYSEPQRGLAMLLGGRLLQQVTGKLLPAGKEAAV